MISKSNHVKFARFVLLGVSEEAKKNDFNFSVQCIIKQLLDSVFVISRIIEVEVGVISRSRNCLQTSQVEVILTLESATQKNARYYCHSVTGY